MQIQYGQYFSSLDLHYDAYYTVTFAVSIIQLIVLVLFLAVHLHFLIYAEEEKLTWIGVGWKFNQFLMILDFTFLCFERIMGIIYKPGNYLFTRFVFNILFHALTIFMHTRFKKYIEEKKQRVPDQTVVSEENWVEKEKVTAFGCSMHSFILVLGFLHVSLALMYIESSIYIGGLHNYLYNCKEDSLCMVLQHLSKSTLYVEEENKQNSYTEVGSGVCLDNYDFAQK